MRDNDVSAGMRNAGKWDPNGSCKAGLLRPVNKKADPGRPSKEGYEYNHEVEGKDGDKFGCWVNLSDECRRRLREGYTDASNLDEKMEKMKREGKKLKNFADMEPDAAAAGMTYGGRHLPISISEYVYFNTVQNRMPLGLEKGFQITANKVSNDEWTGQVPHLTGQVFKWKRSTPDGVVVSFTVEDWVTWENDLKGIPGVRFFEGKKKTKMIEFPTTHLWVDFDRYEMVWFWGRKAVARKVMEIPWILKKPVDWAIGYGLKRLRRGEGYVEGEEEEGEGGEVEGSK